MTYRDLITQLLFAAVIYACIAVLLYVINGWVFTLCYVALATAIWVALLVHGITAIKHSRHDNNIN